MTGNPEVADAITALRSSADQFILQQRQLEQLTAEAHVEQIELDKLNAEMLECSDKFNASTSCGLNILNRFLA